MNWLLERKLNKLADRSGPDRVFVRALQSTLQTQTGHPVWWVQGWKYALAGVSIVALTGSATGVYAYTSDDVLPDTPLYAVRQGIETVEQAAAISPEQKTNVQLRLLIRRLHEQEVLARKQKQLSPTQIQKLDTNLQNVVNLSSNLPTSTQVRIDERVANIEEQHQNALLKDREQAKSPEQQTRVDDLLIKQRDAVQRLIDSLQDGRRDRFKNLFQNRLDQLHQRLDRINKRIDDRQASASD